MKRNYLCIHGHFYQPPRENPWLETVELQESAFPYHDWNERVTRECYGPNSRARLEGGSGTILKLINNYEYMNFDFGPTLLSWLERAHPWIYEQILAADRSSRIRFDGHGNAMAQVYNHLIMPLASTRDKLTQIRWGLADFEHRFGRPAEGMWLAETAVDLETLALMAREGLRYTILAPTQAKAVRSLENPRGQWKEVPLGTMDTTRPYRVVLDQSGHLYMDVFFYDSAISKAVAYEKILASGEAFLGRIESAIPGGRKGPSLVNVATDGESYGHHFKFGDMALAWLFEHLKNQEDLQFTNYAWFLDRFPPRMEVQIWEDSSWSCAHGVERWRSDCGCSVGGRPGWNQAWRKPLRKAMDWLAAELSAVFEEQGGAIFRNPWETRDDYVRILLDSSPENREGFLIGHAAKDHLDAAGRVKALELLESQRMALYMFTSCGWFFDDISGLEASQVLMYAGKAMDLVKPWTKSDLEAAFMSRLTAAKSNRPDFRDGASIFARRIKRNRMTPARIAAHYGMETMTNENVRAGSLFSRRVHPAQEKECSVPGGKEKSGEIRVMDPRTEKATDAVFSARWMGGMDLRCDAKTAEEKSKTYTLRELIPDTRKAVMENLVDNVLGAIQSRVMEESETFVALMELGVGEKEALIRRDGIKESFHLLVRQRLLDLFKEPGKEWAFKIMARLRNLNSIAKDRDWTVHLDDPKMRDLAREWIGTVMAEVGETREAHCLTALMDFLDLADEWSLKLDLWECQNWYWDLAQEKRFMAALSDEQAFLYGKFGRRLGFKVG